MKEPTEERETPPPLGKLSPWDLEQLVLGYAGAPRPEVALAAGVGEDAAALALRDGFCVLATDPITGTQEGMGRLAVHVAVNDVAATGAEPVAILVTLLLPAAAPHSTIERLMKEVHQAAASLEVAIIGGHTERSGAVTQPLLSLTAVGHAPQNRLLASAALQPGDRILLTKGAGVEGTAILAADFAQRLQDAVPEALLGQARELAAAVSIVPEARLAGRHGARALHDVTEGGVLGALWELARAAGCGLHVEAAAIPVAPATQAVCRALEVDPLCLIGSGALLIGAPPAAAAKILAALEEAGLVAAEIGRAVALAPAGDDGPLQDDGAGGRGTPLVRLTGPAGEERLVHEAPTDELWRLLGQT